MADFSDSRNILTRKPRIEFVEPEQIAGEQPIAEPIVTIEDRRATTEELIQQYKRIDDLAVLAQNRIDARVKELRVKLDPSIDAAVVESIKRHFGTEDIHITYEQYKECVDRISQTGKDAAPKLTLEDIKKASIDPFRKDLGGYGSPPGALRPELQVKSPVQPVNIADFKKESLGELFKLLLPKLIGLNEFMIEKAIKELLK